MNSALEVSLRNMRYINSLFTFTESRWWVMATLQYYVLFTLCVECQVSFDVCFCFSVCLTL